MSFWKETLFETYLRCGWVQVRDGLRRLRGRSRAVVLCYHRVGGSDALSKPEESFRDDLLWLSRRFQCVTLSEMCECLRENAPMRRPMAAVTFDDGYRDNFTAAFPLLRQHRVPATFFVATGFISTDRVFPHDARHGGATRANLTWDDLRAMQADGMEIGSHTAEHTNLGRSSEPTIRRELRESLRVLDEQLGQRPRALAFPWGKPPDMSAQAIRLAREAGYYAVASDYGGVNRRGGDSFHIRRIDVSSGRMSQAAFRARVAGLNVDGWRYREPAHLAGRPVGEIPSSGLAHP